MGIRVHVRQPTTDRFVHASLLLQVSHSANRSTRRTEPFRSPACFLDSVHSQAPVPCGACGARSACAVLRFPSSDAEENIKASCSWGGLTRGRGCHETSHGQRDPRPQERHTHTANTQLGAEKARCSCDRVQSTLRTLSLGTRGGPSDAFLTGPPLAGVCPSQRWVLGGLGGWGGVQGLALIFIPAGGGDPYPLDPLPP